MQAVETKQRAKKTGLLFYHNDTTVIQAIAKSKNMITAALNCVFEVLNNPSGPQRANEQGVCAQNPVFNSSTSLYLKKSMPSGMKNSLQREYTALVL